jgi:hypothetical protein
MVFAVQTKGALGAAVAWFVLRLVSFAIWPQIVHHHLARDIHGIWLHDILRICLMTAIGVLVTQPLFNAIAGDDRISILIGLAVSGLLTLVLVAGSYKPLATKILLMLSKPSIGQ